MFDYKDILPAYIAHGKPSADTIRHYETEIDNFLAWTATNDCEPLTVTETEARQYLQHLINYGYSDASVSLKISAARTFYFVAQRLKLIDENPFETVKPKAPVYDDADFEYLKPEELKAICDHLASSNSVTSTRNLAIVMLMAVEGLRTVEVHRMNDADINRKTSSILVHGKGRDAYIYPCADTLRILDHYISIRPNTIRDDAGAPTFISLSSKNIGERITRTGIRWAINNILALFDKKTKGVSCHMLRHTCGTSLYAATKDLRLVQETLRQRSPMVAARYAHVHERLFERNTSNISPFKED